MHRPLGFLTLIFVIVSTTSCITRKDITYLQKNDESVKLDSGIYKLAMASYRIQTNDILNITIRSFNPEVAQIFNSTNLIQGNLGGQGELVFYLNGYSVQPDGTIEIPGLGSVQVLGLTPEEVKERVSAELKKYFKEDASFVSVQLSGIRFSVVGEVKAPGRFLLYQNQATIFDALAMAGDATIFADRKEIQIIRMTPGKVQVHEVNLTDRSILTDPNFLIYPNDIINVKPSPQRVWGIGENGFQTFVDLLTLLSSALTIALVIQNLSN